MSSLGSFLVILSIALALITVAGMIRPSIAMQKDRKSVLVYYAFPAIFTFLIGNSLIS
jgi:hypothetical protein